MEGKLIAAFLFTLGYVNGHALEIAAQDILNSEGAPSLRVERVEQFDDSQVGSANDYTIFIISEEGEEERELVAFPTLHEESQEAVTNTPYPHFKLHNGVVLNDGRVVVVLTKEQRISARVYSFDGTNWAEDVVKDLGRNDMARTVSSKIVVEEGALIVRLYDIADLGTTREGVDSWDVPSDVEGDGALVSGFADVFDTAPFERHVIIEDEP